MKLDPSQERAVALACTEPLGIVTGGAGTGKTTCLRYALDRLEDDGKVVALAAPTGAAAVRMEEATGRAASTVHRLLEFHPVEGWRRNATNPLTADVVVIDESSMLCVEVFSHLLEAIDPARTRLILQGDHHQLPSVGPGRVLADLIESGRVPVARLERVHRAAAETWVAQNAPKVLRGELPDLEARDDFRFLAAGDLKEAAELVEQVVRDDPDAQVLSPQKTTAAGVVALNQRLQPLVNPDSRGLLGAQGWRVGPYEVTRGDRVVQKKNDYTREVFNGEQGLVVSLDKAAMVVDFGRGEPVTFGRSDTRLQLAFAMTVHSVQGNQFDAVCAVVHSSHSHMLDRTLLYTALTRAKKRVVIVGDRKGLARAVKSTRASTRNTELSELLSARPQVQARGAHGDEAEGGKQVK